MRQLAAFSLKRRITVLVLLATALVIGAVSTASVPVELFPQGFESPFLSLFIPWRDAPPQEVLEKIVEPLEEELSTVRGVERITSVARTGRARFFVRFKQGTDMDVAYREVRDRIERARRIFPADVDRVFTFKDDASGIPVFVMGVAVDPTILDSYNLIQKSIVMPLERIDGVASVQVNGLEEKEILIELDRDRAEASNLNIYAIAQDLGSDNFTMASGKVREGSKVLLLRSMARYDNLEALRNRLVGPGVRLKDVAKITYEEADKDYRVRAMSKPAYAVIVFKEGDTNARDVSRRIDAVVEGMRENPRLDGVDLEPFFNQGEVIEESLATLLKSGAIGGLLAALVLFFFLRRFRMMLVVTLTIPLSLVIALTFMFLAGETLNILSLLALMVCVGLLVDNSVVVAENIERIHKLGKSRKEAVLAGAGEIALAITTSTLTTIIVFLPVSLVSGPAQFFLLRMSLPISVALAASLVLALSVIPLGVYLTLPKKLKQDREATGWDRFLSKLYDQTLERVNRVYNRVLDKSLTHRFDMTMIVLLLFGVTMGVGVKRVKFVDVQENEAAGFEIDVELPADYTLEDTEAWFLKAEKIVEESADELDLEGWFQFHTKRFGEIQGWFKNPRTNSLTARDVTEMVAERLPEEPGIVIRTGADREGEDENDGGIFRVALNGEDSVLLDNVAKDLESLFLNVPGVLGVRRASESAPNELALVIDRERTQRFGVDPQAVAGMVGYALRGQSLPKHRVEGKEIPVRVRFEDQYRESLTELASFSVPTMDGSSLPLSAVTDVEMLSSSETIVRRNKQTRRTVSLDLKKDGEEETRKHLAGILGQINLPEGVSFSTRQNREGFDEDLANLLFALGLSVLFIYLLMGLLFESLLLPLSIIFTIPLASLGVYWIHLAARIDLDFLGGVGIVLLVGVVVNNGIVLIDYVNRLRLEGMERKKAILLAAKRRFRPIMMTAITTIGGMIPLAIAGRMDSGISYTSFAMTLIGGMTTATLLTLLVVPVFYTFFDDLRNAMSESWHRGILLPWLPWKNRS